MNQLAIVYWSGTGNTEAMANCIAQGAEEAGAQVCQMGPSEFSASRLSEFHVIAFGKKIALFGSYGWGDGQWMRDWCARCTDANANLFDPQGLMVNEAPDEDAHETCRALGRALASW